MASGSEKRRRDKLVQIRLSPEEVEVVAASAERAGLTVGSFARQALLAGPAPRAVRRPPVELAALAQILAAVGKVGGQVSQLASAAKAGRLSMMGPGPIEEMKAELVEIRAALMSALGRNP